MTESELSEKVIGAAIKVHRALGPGLLESSYEACLCHELSCMKIPFERQVPLPIHYEGISLDCGYRLDILVASALVVELKAVEKIEPLHEAQLMTYLKLGGWTVGLLINFNVQMLTKGIRRRVLGLDETLPTTV